MAFSDAGRIGFVIKGNYDATATYEFLDVVYSNNATYIARKVTTGDPVTDTTAWFCALNADLNGMVHSATINPSASAPFAADWLMENGAVITPQSNDLYRVLVEGKERLYFWNGTSYEILSGGGHTIEKVNPISGSIMPMGQQDNLLFTGVNVTNDDVNKRTTIHGQLKVCATKAEWDALSQTEKDDPNTYWVRPWADTVAFATDKTPVGTVLSVATGKTGDGISGITTPTGTFPTADYLVCDGQSVSVATYPALATYFQTRYGSTYYFGGSGASFSLPNWSSDFPSNGVLVMKARESSNAMSITEIDDTSVSEDKTWSSEKIDSEIDELSDTSNTILNDLGAKNLCPNKGITHTINGVTFTVNSDGTVTANGTANGTAVFYCISNALFKKGTYVVNGTPDGGDYGNTYALGVSIHATGSTVATDAAHPSLTDTFIVTNETEKYVLSIIVRSGQTVSNLTFKPMIRPASIKDDTYVPYAMTNRALSNYCLMDYSNFEDISSYATESYSTFNAPYTGWYYMRISTGSQNATPFVRLSLVGGYVFEMSGVTGAYKYVSTPPIFITAGTVMVAQGAPGCVNQLYVKKVNL